MLDLNQFTGYTPGPWRVQKPRGHQHAIDRKWEIVAPLDQGELVIIGEHTGIDCLRKDNARLIAAAPDLLELCRQQQAEIGRFRNMVVTWVDGDLDGDLDRHQVLAIDALYKDSEMYIR